MSAAPKRRVGVDGPQSTGKSTLVNELASMLGGVYNCIPETARVLAPAYGIRTREEWLPLIADRARLTKFFDDEESWQASQEDRHERFIVDSSFFQIAAYRLYHGVQCDLSRAVARQYDLLLYLPPSLPPVEDGFRIVDGRESVAAIYLEITARWYGGEAVVLAPSPNRVQLAVQHILANK